MEASTPQLRTVGEGTGACVSGLCVLHLPWQLRRRSSLGSGERGGLLASEQIMRTNYRFGPCALVRNTRPGTL